MLTFFTTAKPFKGHTDIIQQNALKSWKLLHPEVEVIVFGDDEGSAAVCKELGLRHEPHVGRTAGGAIRLDNMFAKAQVLARHDVLCYVNCDIILLQDFLNALEPVRERWAQFLMIGRRWDTDIRESIDFRSPGWQDETRQKALSSGRRHDVLTIDYFAFRRGLYGPQTPPLAIGRFWWDHWLVRRALDLRVPVVDVSRGVVAIHQNHNFAHHPQGWKGLWDSEDARRNLELAGGPGRLATIEKATHRLTRKGRIVRRLIRLRTYNRRMTVWLKTKRMLAYNIALPSWHFLLDVTRPVRSVLGLRSKRRP